MGASIALAMSDGYGVEREKRGSVVKPIWLLRVDESENNAELARLVRI